jgi:ribosome recycling factor
MLGPIEKSIFEANLGVTPQNNGEIIIINIPPLTEERRIKLGKDAKALGEDSKVSIRNVRRDAITEFKNAVKDGFPEDIGKRKEKEIEDLTKKYIDKIDALIASKEKDIMTI